MSVRGLILGGIVASCATYTFAEYKEAQAQPAATPTSAAPSVPGSPLVTGPSTASVERWIDDWGQAALQQGANESSKLVAALRMHSVSRRAAPGYAEAAMLKLARAPGISWALSSDIALLAGDDHDADASATATPAAAKAGVVSAFALLAPLRDTGGGLARREGPEASGSLEVQPDADYSWGTVEARWRTIPSAYVGAAGVPLDVFVHPRKESCSYLASAITVANDTPLTIRVAAAGQVRVMWDGTEVALSEEVMAKALLDRLAVTVSPRAGVHLLGVKVCSGALVDSGRVRVRLEANGAAAAFQASADLVKLALLRPAKDTPPPAQAPTHVAIKTPLEFARETTVPGRADVTASAQRQDVVRLSGEPALTQALVRTVGGADDLRSPRAQGLVDSIAAVPTAPASRLLDAAAASPLGAPRIALLHRAERKASTEGDSVTAARALRELIRTRLGMPDWALATARRANLMDATDADGKLLASELWNNMGSDALRMDAYLAAADTFRRAPQQLSNAQLDQLQQLAGALDRSVARDVTKERMRRGVHGAQDITLVAALGSDAELADAARRHVQRDMRNFDSGMVAVSALRAAGKRDVATEILGKLVYYSPNRSDVWEALAQVQAGTPAGAQALERARKLAPTNAALRAQAAFERSGTAAKPERDEAYLRPSAEVTKRRMGVPKGPTDVSERELYWLRAVTMHPDQRVSQLIHYAREIVIAPRTQEELNEDLPQEGELTELLRARVHRASGGLAYPTEESNDGFRPRIRWPELHPGDVVEVAVRSYTRSAVGGRGDSPFYFMDYAGSQATRPLLYNEVVVDYPKTRPIYVDVLGVSKNTKTESDDGDRHIVRMVWDTPIQIVDEPLAPPLSETVPMVVGSTYRNWDEFRTWYREAVKGFTEPDLEVQRIAKELTKSKLTREAKVRALFEFVADDIRYVNYVSGEWWLPNRPQQLLARREGDCDDKAILLISLLRAVGIEAEEVLVQTRMTNMPTVVGAKNVAIPLFDHGIAFLPGPNGGQYLDATSPQSRLGPLPGMDARASALRLWGPAEIVRLPESSSADHGARVRWVVRIAADGSATINAEEQHRGDQAFYTRMNLKEKDARRAFVEENLVSPWVSMVTVDDAIGFDGDIGQGRARVTYKAASAAYARRELRTLVVPLGGSQSIAAQLAPLPQRTLPVELPPQLAPSATERELVLQAPVGYTFERAPLGDEGGRADGGEFGLASLVFKRAADGREVTVTRKIAFEANRISVERYPAFRAWLQQIDALMNRELRLVPGASASQPATGAGQ
jgi:tetratricopeptide (TPR) repeat protein